MLKASDNFTSLAFPKLKNFCKIVFIYFFFFKFACANETIILEDIENKILILDIYGNRYLTTKNNILKSGDFLRSTEDPAVLLIKNNKICFSKSSSIKIKSINKSQKLIEVIILTGKFLFFTNRIRGFKFHLIINNNKIENNSGHLFLSKNSQNSFYIKTFKDSSNLYTSSSKKMKLSPNSFYEITSNVKTKKNKDNFKLSYFLNQCLTQKDAINSPNEMGYQCSVINGKISCGYK